MVAVFVGTQCRGVAHVTTNSGNAYVTLLANLALSGETIGFKIWDYETQTIYPVVATYAVSFGQILGGTTPVPLNGSDEVVIPDPPVLDPITTIDETSGCGLTWQPVEFATEYQIFRSLEGPYSGFVLIGTSTNPNFTDAQAHDHAFYMIKAVNNPITKGGSK